MTAVESPACAVVGNIIYFLGGDDTSGNESGLVQGYVSSSNTWGYGSNYGFTPRTRASTGVLNGLIYVVGGYNPGITGNNGGYLQTVEAYNPLTNTWNDTLSSMGILRANAGVGVVNGILYVFGGITNSGSTNVMQAYNPTSNLWTFKASLPFSGSGDGVVVNGVLYAFSDVTDSVASNSPTVYAYNPSTDTWTSHCQMPNHRAGFGVVAVSNDLYAIGGLGVSTPFTGLNEKGVF
jgi:N-acetylneuraminic acid mutarotase